MKTHTDERGLTRFFLEPKDVEIPDEPIVVDKDLLYLNLLTLHVNNIPPTILISRASGQ